MASGHATSREIEIKLKIHDLSALLRKLKSLRCRCEGRVFDRNILFDTPSQDFRRHGRLLRVRTEIPAGSRFAVAGSRRTVITSKAPAPEKGASRYKDRLEREVAVKPGTSWDAVLRPLGLRPGFIYEKYRTSYRRNGLHLDLDQTPVGTFLELEGSPQAIDRYARALGFHSYDYIRGTYWDLLQENNRRTGRKSRNMLFTSQKSRKKSL
jgi:adenylate cyclase, class 2